MDAGEVVEVDEGGDEVDVGEMGDIGEVEGDEEDKCPSAVSYWVADVSYSPKWNNAEP